MRGTEAQMQEPQRIEQRLLRMPETIEHRALCHIGGALAVGMPTQGAIAGDQQRRIFKDLATPTRSWLLSRPP